VRYLPFRIALVLLRNRPGGLLSTILGRWLHLADTSARTPDCCYRRLQSVVIGLLTPSPPRVRSHGNIIATAQQNYTIHSSVLSCRLDKHFWFFGSWRLKGRQNSMLPRHCRIPSGNFCRCVTLLGYSRRRGR